MPCRCIRISLWNSTRADAWIDENAKPASLLAGFFFCREGLFFGQRVLVETFFPCAAKPLAGEDVFLRKTEGVNYMTYRLYGDLGSGAFSAEAALAEAGAPYEFELISLDKGEQKEPRFLSLNPSGKIPALRLPEGEIVTESAAILLTLADHFPQSGLLPPQAAPARAAAYRWLAFMASEIYPFVEIVDYPARFVPEGKAAIALKEVAVGRIRERLLLIERVLAGPFFLAGGFSILDIYAAMFSRWSVGAEWREAQLPRVMRLVRLVSQRPAVAPVWKRHFERDQV
jgi:glutathione S-transferase